MTARALAPCCGSIFRQPSRLPSGRSAGPGVFASLAPPPVRPGPFCSPRPSHGRHAPRFGERKSARPLLWRNTWAKLGAARRRLNYPVIQSNSLVYKLLKRNITEYFSVIDFDHKMCQPGKIRNYCLIHASLRHQTAANETGRGFHLSHMWQYCLRDNLYAEFNNVGAGSCNPVTHSGRDGRCNFPGRR